MPIGSGATFSGASSAQTQNLIAPSVPAWINAAEYSHPVYRASTADPLVRVDWRYGTVSPWVNGSSTFRIPAAAQAAPGVDAHLHVVDPDGVTLRETFELAGTGDVRTAGKYAVFDLRGSGIGTTPGTNSGTRAYGGSSLGGLIRTWELDAGSIRHVLALALTNGQLRDGYVWPATSQDTWGAAYAGLVPMGALVAIPPTVDLTSLGLSPAGLTVARALQDYGAYVVDRSASFTLYAEPSAESRLAAARADMPRIRALLQVVTNNGPSSVGGGGTPRRPLAPVL
jgi:hypothetical protein